MKRQPGAKILSLKTNHKNDELTKAFDVTTLPDLVLLLRKKLNNKQTNIVLLADRMGCSKSFLYEFRNGKAVCMDILNHLANHFQIKYVITNFDPDKLNGIAWHFPSERKPPS